MTCRFFARKSRQPYVGHEDGVQVRTNQFAIRDVEPGRLHRSGYQVLPMGEIVPVVRGIGRVSRPSYWSEVVLQIVAKISCCPS